MKELYCQHYGRPFCLGTQKNSDVQLEYVKKFVNQYRSEASSFAVFAHFIDSHEDSLTLSIVLEDPIIDILKKIDRYSV